MSDGGLVKCEEKTCGEWTRPRADGTKRCPKHYPGAAAGKPSRKKDSDG